MTPYERLEAATAELDPPFALVDLDAFWWNAADLLRRAAGKPIRVASKSVRCRSLLDRVLEHDGFKGTLCFTLAEALWLASHGADDLCVAYPTTDRAALRSLAELRAERSDLLLAVMIDDVAQLDLIEATVGAIPVPIQVCLDVDAGLWLAGGRIKIGAKRSPVHHREQAVELAREVSRRSAFELAGVMSYEAQIAGVGDRPAGHPLRARAISAMQRRSVTELAERRAEIVGAIAAIAPLRFVNGGGTGSVHLTTKEGSVTEIAAGSGLFAPLLFDRYSGFTLKPAAMFALSVVRKSSPDTATLLGGGYPASGKGDATRLPQPYLPEGLSLDKEEGAGEVQTPLLGRPAAGLAVGDRVYLRHAKAGEMCERFNSLHLIEGDAIVEEVPTYRGEGRCFL